MEPLISRALREALSANRDALNRRVRRAKAGGARIDSAALLRHIGERVGPAVDAIHERAPGRVPAAVAELFELSVEIFARGLGRADGLRPEVELAWRALPPLADALAAAPRLVARDMIHGALRLEQEVTGAAARWCGEVMRTAEFAATPDALRRIALVLAWTCGLAHARSAALEAWRTLGDRAAGAVFVRRGEPLPDRGALERRLADRWWRPGPPGPPRIEIAARLGGSAALGGPFAAPPRVALSEGALYALDGASAWRIHADAFGATLRRSRMPAGATSRTEPFAVHRSGRVGRGGLRYEAPLLEDPSSAAATDDTLAVTTGRSYRISIVACISGVP